MIRIAVVEDHEIVRDALANLLADTPDMEVVAVASSLRDALPLLAKIRPKVVLADLALEDGSGLELVRALRRERRKVGHVLILTGLRDAYSATEALAGGAAGYVLKSQSSSDLLLAIRTVATGASYVAPEIAAKLAAQQGAPKPGADAPPDPPTGLGALSHREHEVFRQVVWGYSTKDIARRLSISVKTVETHRTNMNRKLNVRTTADVIRLAMAHGIAVAPSVSSKEVGSNRPVEQGGAGEDGRLTADVVGTRTIC
jgi:DNA-binding NarL/FixJ family response regulator